MQDFSQRASAKTMTTNRLLPTSDHVSTSVYIDTVRNNSKGGEDGED